MAEVWKGKKWYTLMAPKMFGAGQIAEAPLGDPKQVVGRTLWLYLSDLVGDPSKYFYKVKLRVTKLDGATADTEFAGYECARDHVARMIRRRIRRIDGRLITTTKDGEKRIIVKSLATCMKKADTGTEKALRGKIEEEIGKTCKSMELEAFMKGVFGGELQKAIRKEASKIYPLRDFEITKVEMS